MEASLDIIDSMDDSLTFTVVDGALKLDVGGAPHCPRVQSIEYEVIEGVVVTEGATGAERGQFQFQPERQIQEAEALRKLAAQASVPFLELETPLPPSIEALLVDDDLVASRPGVRILWNRVLQVYPDEEAALAAVARNSALVLPYLNRPYNIDGSWRVLNELMSPEEALDAVTKNPGLLACNPAGLKQSNAADVQRAAAVVDQVESLPLAARWGGVAAVTAGVTALVAKGFFESCGSSDACLPF